MYKLFTPSQATDLIGVVDPMLRDLQGALRDVKRLQLEQTALRPSSLRAQQLKTELTFVIESAQLTKTELDRLGVFVKDLGAGVVDFPGKLGAEVVYLCWAQGEDAVTHYHALSQAAEERQPLPTAFTAEATTELTVEAGLMLPITHA